MKVLATSDFHGSYKAFQKAAGRARESNANALVVCGDVTHFGTLEQAMELLSCLLEANCPVVFVPGNCDSPLLAEKSIGRIISIHGKCAEIGGFSFLGVGGSSPSPFDTPFELSEEEIDDVLTKGFNCCETEEIILVSHSPPRNMSVDFTHSGEHVGSVKVRKFVENVQPKLVLCGHIHEASGVDHVGRTVVVNPGSARHGRCALIEIDEKVEVNLTGL